MQSRPSLLERIIGSVTGEQPQQGATTAPANPLPSPNPLPQMQMPAPANPSGEIGIPQPTNVIPAGTPQQMPEVAMDLPEDIDPVKAANASPEVLTKGKAAEAAVRELSVNPDREDSWFENFGQGVSNFFGNKENMLSLALAFNSLRYQPDQGLAAVLGKQLETYQTTSKANKTAAALMKSKNPRDRRIAKLLMAGFTLKEAYAAEKQTDFDKQLAYVGGDLNKWNEIFGKKGDVINVDTGEGSEGLKQVDKEFGKEYTKYVIQGGRANASKNLGTLRTVIDKIKSGENLSGALIGLSPDQGLNLFAPDAKAARDRVAGVVQQSLKETLGAQFTEKEARELINRAYDPALSEAENLARLEALAMVVEASMKAKEHAMAYYGKGFTMLGYNPQEVAMPSQQDFYDAMNAAVARMSPIDNEATGTPVGTVKTFTTRDGKTASYKKVSKGADSDPSTWQMEK